MTKWKNIKTDTMLQYLSHGSGIRNVRHMDVYLNKRYAMSSEPAFLSGKAKGWVDVKVSPNALGVEAERSRSNQGNAKRGESGLLNLESEEARKLRDAENGTLFVMSPDEAFNMATQLLIAVSDLRDSKSSYQDGCVKAIKEIINEIQ